MHQEFRQDYFSDWSQKCETDVKCEVDVAIYHCSFTDARPNASKEGISLLRLGPCDARTVVLVRNLTMLLWHEAERLYILSREKCVVDVYVSRGLVRAVGDETADFVQAF